MVNYVVVSCQIVKQFDLVKNFVFSTSPDITLYSMLVNASIPLLFYSNPLLNVLLFRNLNIPYLL